jgi:DNA-binding transcriptional MerR regulator
MKMYSKDGAEVDVEKEQIATMKAAGFTVEKVEKVVEKEQIEPPKDDFEYLTEEQVEALTLKKRAEYKEKLAAQKEKIGASE